MAQSESIAALAAALCETQFEMEGAKKDSVNPHFKSRYADLTSVWDACRAALHKHGLSVVQAPEPSEIGIQLRTVLLHKSGEWIDSTLLIPAQQQNAQGFGSAMSYARRYALASMIGIVADEDDDGDKASEQRAARTSYQPPTGQPVTNGSGAVSKASDKQIKKLFVMWKEGNFDGTLQDWIQKTYGCKVDDLNVKQASEAIEALQEPA